MVSDPRLREVLSQELPVICLLAKLDPARVCVCVCVCVYRVCVCLTCVYLSAIFVGVGFLGRGRSLLLHTPEHTKLVSSPPPR